MYDATARRFAQEDPIRSGRNWYGYVGNDPVNYVDPWGLDAYVYYDPNRVIREGYDTAANAQLYADELAAYFGTKAYIIPMTTPEQLEKDWNKMGNNGKDEIDAVLFLNHATPHIFQIHTGTDGEKSATIDKNFFNNPTMTKQTIDYFILLGCRLGNSEYDTGNNLNFAMTILKSKHIFGTLVASDMQSWSYGDDSTTRISSGYGTGKSLADLYTGDDFKTYKWNYSTGSADITPIGNVFDTITDMVAAASAAVPIINTNPSSGNNDKKIIDKRTIISSGYVNADGGMNLRQGAGTNYPTLGRLAKGDTFNCYGAVTGGSYTWYEVQMTSGKYTGQSGYLAGDYISMFGTPWGR